MSFLQGLHAELSPKSQIYESYCESAKRCMQYSAIKHVSCQKDTCHCTAKLCSLLHTTFSSIWLSLIKH